ncbi:acyltransferase family protein [uncultured Tessaracoccus sp.]|uniref:acyltransferase family protein n=1 Tax=uncultured Tessaracoccus sp. TaxID=905023 RepID=UPI002619C900|nr:acyltransferase family protein [uncultured Tessaracoccus sp.]
MPMLLAMSGMLLANSVHKPLSSFASGKLRRVLWPYVVWTLVTLACLGELSSATRPQTWIVGPYHMWFLAVLLCCYPIAWFTRWIPAWVMMLGMLGVLVVADPSTNWIRRVLFFGAMFMLGVAVRRHLTSILTMPVWIVGVAGLVGVVIACSHAFGWGIPMVDQGQVWTWLLPWEGVFTVIWLWSRAPRMPALEWLGQKSIVLYCVHFPAQALSALAFQEVAESAPWLFLLIQITVGFAVPALFLWGYRFTGLLFEFPQLPAHKRQEMRR